MEKIFNWLSKYLLEVLVLVMIVVIALYIIHFAESISDKVEKIITAFAAVVATFFLFLAFREAKKANDLKVYEPVFNELNKKVSEKELKANTKVFADEHILLIEKALNSNETTLDFVFYSNFVYCFLQTFSLIKSNTKYSDYIKLLDDKNLVKISTDLFDVNELKRAAFVLKILQGGLLLIIMNYIEIYFIYDSVQSSSLLTSQKKLLINRLNKTVDDEFFYILNSLRNIPIAGDEYDDELYESCKELRNFQFFMLLGENEIIKHKSDLEYISTEFDYTRIREQYAH
jgi:hypothetical protein